MKGNTARWQHCFLVIIQELRLEGFSLQLGLGQICSLRTHSRLNLREGRDCHRAAVAFTFRGPMAVRETGTCSWLQVKDLTRKGNFVSNSLICALYLATTVWETRTSQVTPGEGPHWPMPTRKGNFVSQSHLYSIFNHVWRHTPRFPTLRIQAWGQPDLILRLYQKQNTS